jgi:hypothetical protein
MSNQAQAIEEPEYVVVYEDGDIEFRQYQPYIVAETVVDGSTSYGRASNEGFMRLFRFITGNNSSQVDIDMTAPVQQAAISEEISMTAPVQRSQTDSGWRVAFMLPSEYSMETAPLPTDERVNLRTIPGRLMAVVRYSGRWTEKNYDKHENLLIDYVNANDLRVLGKPESAAYDAPYVLPFLRRNEVMIAVSDVPQMMQSNPEQ